MDMKEKLVEQAISHFWYGISHDIFSEPVTTYAKLAIEALEKEKESGVTVQEWISVKDRLPEETKDEYVLVVCDYYGKIEVETRKMWHIDSVVTHWMPLPQPPKGE